MKKIIYFAAIAISIVVLLSGCVNKEPPSTFHAASLSSSEYFPMEKGMEWSYKIEFGNTDPLMHFALLWKDSNGAVDAKAYKKTMDRDKLKSKYKNCCHYRIRINGTKSNEKMFAADINVIEDDLGVYNNYRNSEAWLIGWVVLYSDESYKVTSFVNYGDSFEQSQQVVSPQLLFFEPKKVGDEMKVLIDDDYMKFVGYDYGVPDYPEIKTMHFVRTVPSLDMTEDTWFAPGKGLIRLEQKVDGIPSMTWTLENFSNN